MDQCFGHGKKMEGGSNAMEMGLRFGTGEKKILNKTKKILVKKIKASQYRIRGHLSKDELERIANKKSIGFTYKLNIKKGAGWERLTPDPLGEQLCQ